MVTNIEFAMENFLSLVEGPKATWVSNSDEIDQETMQEFLQKTSVWDFYDMTRDEYMNESDNDTKSLIVKFFNQILEGTNLLFVSLLFEFCSLITISSASLVFKFIEFSSVSGLLSSLSVKVCSVSVALPAVDLLLAMSEISESVSLSSLK